MIRVLLIAWVAVLLTAVNKPARAHAVINEASATAGEFAFVTLRITHGCGESPTTEVRVKIPAGVTRVSTEFSEHWQLATRQRKLDPPLEAPGGHQITDTVDELIWTGGRLPNGFYGQFQMRAMMPAEAGRVLWFDTIQKCEQGEIRWIEHAQPGQNPLHLKEPAPFLKLVE